MVWGYVVDALPVVEVHLECSHALIVVSTSSILVSSQVNYIEYPSFSYFLPLTHLSHLLVIHSIYSDIIITPNYQIVIKSSQTVYISPCLFHIFDFECVSVK